MTICECSLVFGWLIVHLCLVTLQAFLKFWTLPLLWDLAFVDLRFCLVKIAPHWIGTGWLLLCYIGSYEMLVLFPAAALSPGSKWVGLFLIVTMFLVWFGVYCNLRFSVRQLLGKKLLRTLTVSTLKSTLSYLLTFVRYTGLYAELTHSTFGYTFSMSWSHSVGWRDVNRDIKAKIVFFLIWGKLENLVTPLPLKDVTCVSCLKVSRWLLGIRYSGDLKFLALANCGTVGRSLVTCFDFCF